MSEKVADPKRVMDRLKRYHRERVDHVGVEIHCDCGLALRTPAEIVRGECSACVDERAHE